MNETHEFVAITALLHRYLFHVDTHDAALFTSNFAEDGVYVSPFGTASGRAQILATIEQWHAGGMTAGKRHMAGPAEVTIEGDRATARSSYFVIETADRPGIVASGTYTDQLVKVDGQWKFARREQTVDPSFKF